MSSPSARGDFLPLFHFGDGAQQVAIAHGLLVVLLARGFFHALAQAARQIAAPPFEEHPDVARGFRVALVRDQPFGARPQAAVNVILQARARMAAREVHRARGHQKMLVNQMDQAVREARGEVGPEIDRAVFFETPRHVHARIFLERRVANVGIGLVVAQQDIEFRLVLLDQIVFERERFLLVVHDDVSNVGDLAHERACLRVAPPRFQKIGLHARTQRPRLAHVEDFSGGVLEDVHPGLQGQLLGFFEKFHFRRATIDGVCDPADSGLDERQLSGSQRQSKLDSKLHAAIYFSIRSAGPAGGATSGAARQAAATAARPKAVIGRVVLFLIIFILAAAPAESAQL